MATVVALSSAIPGSTDGATAPELARHYEFDAGPRGLQLRAARYAGRWYLRLDRQRERLRIAKARVPDRIAPLRSTTELLRLQRPLFAGLVVLILLGAALDAAVRTVGSDLLQAAGIDQWIRDTFTLPSTETLRTLLAAAAGGTATILGLVSSRSASSRGRRRPIAITAPASSNSC